MAQPSFPFGGFVFKTAPLARWNTRAYTQIKVPVYPTDFGVQQFYRFVGRGRIVGTVKVITTPAPARVVRLYHRGSGILVKETLSAGDGTYSFTALNHERTYFVTAFDVEGGYNATIADFVVPSLS